MLCHTQPEQFCLVILTHGNQDCNTTQFLLTDTNTYTLNLWTLLKVVSCRGLLPFAFNNSFCFVTLLGLTFHIDHNLFKQNQLTYNLSNLPVKYIAYSPSFNVSYSGSKTYRLQCHNVINWYPCELQLTGLRISYWTLQYSV